MAQVYPTGSPKWSSTTKLVVGLSFVLITAWLISRFKGFLGPLLLAFILTYLSYPVAGYIRNKLKLSWRLSVTIFYILLVVFFLGILTVGGVVLLEQGQSLLNLVQQALFVALPDLVSHLSTQVIHLGHLEFDLSKLDLTSINNEILSYIQPAIGQMGTLLGKIASSAASFLSWVSFIVLISYFMTAESGGMRNGLINLEIPGYSGDLKKISFHLDRIWNVFLRGQFILFLLSAFIFTVILAILGVHYAWGLGLICGLARFLPYIGPFIAWSAMGLVAYFQGSTIFGLSALGYVVLVVGLAMLIDSIFDNFVAPNFFGSTLQVHPAAVLVTALVAANLIGLIGVLLAAPVLATLQLVLRYTLRKMVDLDPWGEEAATAPPHIRPVIPKPISRLLVYLAQNIKRPLKPKRTQDSSEQ